MSPAKKWSSNDLQSLINYIPIFCTSVTSWDTPKAFLSSLKPTHHFFHGHLICLTPTAITVQRLIQSVPSLCSICPYNLSLPFLIIQQTGSNPNNILIFTFFHSFNLQPYIHVIVLISVRTLPHAPLPLTRPCCHTSDNSSHMYTLCLSLLVFDSNWIIHSSQWRTVVRQSQITRMTLHRSTVTLWWSATKISPFWLVLF